MSIKISSWVLGSFCFQLLHIELYNYDFQLLFFKIKSKNALPRNIFDKSFKITLINHIWLKFLNSYIQYLTVKSYSRTVSNQTELSFILSLRYSSLQKIEFAQDLSGRSKVVFYHFQDPSE